VSPIKEFGSRILVIFDGHCGLCNRVVRWFLARDRQGRLRFAPSDSPQVSGLLAKHGFTTSNSETKPGTILVIRDPDGPSEQTWVRSDAVVALLLELPRPWPAVAILLRTVPRPLRDLGYRLIARWRYRFWERLESCPVPTPDERARFL
jgi:predicted DCC family thiol-disulfide oxidoreductase YuxK